MAELTLRQAAEQVGVSRQTIYRMVSDGRLTATLRPDPTRTGQGTAKGAGTIKVIDTAELQRVFGRLTPDQAATVAPGHATAAPGLSMTGGVTGQETPAPGLQAMTAEDRRFEYETADRATLRAELAAAKATIADLRTALQEAKDRESRLFEQNIKLMDQLAGQTRLLEHKAQAETPPRGFWRRLVGK